MIIKKLDIARFGCLENKSVSLSPNLNVIYGKNESGKSTLSSFIEAMLFGYHGRDAERKKYIPWGETSSSGSITLEHDGDVTIYRTLASSSKGDDLKLLPSDADLSFIPESRETYRRSVYCREACASDFGSTDEIERKLSNIFSSSSENLSVARALDSLSSARRTLRPARGSSGKIDQIESKLTELENERYATLSHDSQAESAKTELRQKEKLLSELYARRNEYKSLNAEIISLKEEISKLNGEIHAQEEYIASFPQLDASPPSPSKLFSFNLVLYIICALVLFIIGFIFSSPLKFLSIVPLAVFAFVYVASFVKSKSFLKNSGCTSYDEYEKMRSDKDDAVQYLSAIRTKRADLIARYSDFLSNNGLDSVNDRIIKLKDEINELKNTLLSFNHRSVDEIDSNIAYYRAERAALLTKLNAIDSAISAIEYAKERLSRDFTPQITEKAREYIALIAPKDKRDVFLEKDLSVSLTDPSPVSMSSCSFGLKQEIYICVRIALSEVLYGSDMPLIFDDPFLGSDDYREKSLIDLFAAIAKKRQVIIFTNRKNPYFEQIDCNYIDIGTKNSV